MTSQLTPGDQHVHTELHGVILPTTSIASVFKALRANTLTVANRLKSIASDADFVTGLADTYTLPLVANLRCGEWYISPHQIAGFTYFKSTDGHYGSWDFSVRRLNLHIFDVVKGHAGCILVDSTRRGKSMPDAFSKTVPIWCAVLNQLLFPEHENAGRLRVPNGIVSRSEYNQINEKLPQFLLRCCKLRLDLTLLRSKLSSPLRPVWVFPGSSEVHTPQIDPAYTNIVLCTASKNVQHGDLMADGYVQGAGDDNEHWSLGLTPQLFWQNKEQLLASSEAQLPKLIKALVRDMVESQQERALVTKVSKGHEVYTGTDALLKTSLITAYDFVIHCNASEHINSRQTIMSHYIHLKCRDGRLGSKDLRGELPRLVENATIFQTQNKILVCGQNGSDLSKGAALYLICILSMQTETSGTSRQLEQELLLDKPFIERIVGQLSAFSNFTVSRATLRAVRDALLSREHRPQHEHG